MDHKGAVVLFLLLLVVLPAYAQEIEITADRRYYQPGDLILIHIKWNGTVRYGITLGPYLKLREWRYTGFQDVPPSITRTARDPDQWWTVEVLKPNATAIQTPSYFDIGIFNVTTGEMIKVMHRDIIILNVTQMTSEYMADKQKINELQGQVESLKGEVGRQQQISQIYEARAKELERMTEISRRFTRYFDYVKFVNKSLQELGVVMGNIQMSITVPVYYDPKQDQWITPKVEDLMIKNGRLYVKVPWYVVGNATNTTVAYTEVSALMDPENILNIYLWNEWFNNREEEAKKEYQTLFSWSWIVPLGAVGIIVIAIILLRFWLWRWLKKMWRTMEERGVVPPV